MSECLICKKKENGLYPVFVCPDCLRHAEIGRRMGAFPDAYSIENRHGEFILADPLVSVWRGKDLRSLLRAAKIGEE